MDEETEEERREWYEYGLMRNGGSCREWWDSKKMKGKYMMRNLARHLVRGGMWDELFYVLTDVRWTLRRLKEGGLADLRDDFDRMVDAMKDYERRTEQGAERDEMRRRESDGAQILVDVISDCWDVLQGNKHQFGFQIYGRIQEQYTRYCAVSRYMSSMKRNGPKPWVRPMRTGLLSYKDKRQRGQLKLEGDCSKIKLCPNRDYICTSEFSNSYAKLWFVDWRSREIEQLMFEFPKTPTCFDFCFATWQVAFGFKDGTIEIRDVETRKLVGNPFKVLSQGRDRNVSRVTFNEVGSRLGSVSDGCTTQIWNISNKLETQSL